MPGQTEDANLIDFKHTNHPQFIAISNISKTAWFVDVKGSVLALGASWIRYRAHLHI